MKQILISSLALLLSSVSFAQVGIGTTTPISSSILDLTSTNKGLLLPRVANTAAVTGAVNGLLIYDLSAKCLKVYQNGAWSDCLSTSTPAVSAACTGFVGSYCTSDFSGTAYVVTLTNNDFATKQVTPQTTDLSLSGITGLSVSTVSPNTVTPINTGASLVITYTISGTPGTTGTLTGTFSKQGLSCTSTVVVENARAVTAASATPTLCVDTALTPITHTTTGATGIGTATGLPAGVTAAWASNTLTISGTPTVAGTYTYSIPVNGCGAAVNATGTITVITNAVTAASATPTLCINTVLTPITHTTTNATGIGTAANLPAGVTATWASNTITISGTPTVAGTYTYSVPVNGCGPDVNATGTITVITNVVTAASATPTVCSNTALTPITHTTTNATGIGTATGLPAGVTAAWASNTLTISGTPTVAGAYTYSIPVTGCGPAVNATGTITVILNKTVTAASATPTLCANTALTPITHTTAGATGIGTATNLPAGVTATWASNTITISGTPTASGTFNYTIPVNGCGAAVSATGTITVTPILAVTAVLANPVMLINYAMTNVTHTTTGATGIGTATGLPAGVTATWASNSITISGTPTVLGTYNYSIPLNGVCGPAVNATGTLMVVNCGAYVAAGVFKAFMCHNLGANTALDPNIPVQGIHGNYYQWGRATVVANASTAAGAIPGWNTTNAPNGSWSDSSKTANDPCPTGFRVPTQAQWNGVVANNTISRAGVWGNNSTNFPVAIHFGPNSSTKTLTLPAAGARRYDSLLASRGDACYYQSSTTIGTYSSSLFCNNSMAFTSSDDTRVFGMSVRCIAE